MKIVILEGLPMVGKTTIINYIKSLSLKNVHVVNELIINTEELNQDTFMNNDIKKINKYKSGLVIIDRGLISTLSYNEMLEKLNGNIDLERVYDWFNKYGIPFYNRNDVYTYYLYSNEKFLRENDINAPNGSIDNQLELELLTINNIKKYCYNYELREYKKSEMEEFVNEIINKYMQPWWNNKSL